jgi:hypothetical protein
MTNQLKAMMLVVIVVLAFLIMPESKAATETVITQDTTSTVTTNGNQTTTVKSPPPSAIAPQFGGSNSDLCTISSSGSVQTQILGISLGATYTEENCLRLKKAQKLYMFGMKGSCSFSYVSRPRRVGCDDVRRDSVSDRWPHRG